MTKITRSFIVTALGLIILAILGVVRGLDVSSSVVTLASIYISARGATKASHVWAASNDPNADTNKAVELLKD
jgi:hypothetical protein